MSTDCGPGALGRCCVPIVGTPLAGDSVCCGAEPDVSIVAGRGIGRGSGIGGTFNRPAGMSGGATGGCPLLTSGPYALPTSVAHPPLPRVAPMLHDTWWLPADQLGSEIVL